MARFYWWGTYLPKYGCTFSIRILLLCIDGAPFIHALASQDVVVYMGYDGGGLVILLLTVGPSSKLTASLAYCCLR